jgi:hypothetical protein
VPHTLRHAAATHLIHRLKWERSKVRSRGRWESEKSLERYSKPHILVRHEAGVREEVRSKGETFWADPVVSFFDALHLYRASQGLLHA